MHAVALFKKRTQAMQRLLSRALLTLPLGNGRSGDNKMIRSVFTYSPADRSLRSRNMICPVEFSTPTQINR